jgi:hypothetical protein
MVLPYLKGLIVIEEVLHIVLVYLLWCFCIQSLVLNKQVFIFILKIEEKSHVISIISS